MYERIRGGLDGSVLSRRPASARARPGLQGCRFSVFSSEDHRSLVGGWGDLNYECGNIPRLLTSERDRLVVGRRSSV